ncbi:MAG: Holliday junction resolvase RuvX [Candidatus Zixiibacteriota bacterium]|nr:MAG: Holliday junction resolvase RuvX [candidate division Zixibacteria bacterium]
MSVETERTYLGIDYGSRRIGVAKSDPTGLIASALTTLEVRSWRQAIGRLRELIAEYAPRGVVVGYPLHASGEPSAKCEEVEHFIGKLSEVYDGPVYRMDERYSSEEAQQVIHAHGKKAGRDKKRIDRLAAVIILQRFLDERRQS